MKGTFGISDIQDEEDIYGRLVLNQKKRLKKKKVIERPKTLAEKVRLVEQRRSRTLDSAVNEESNTPEAEGKSTADEYLPAYVEDQELAQENLDSMVKESKLIRDSYEELELHYLFDDLRTNFLFRLFVTAVSYGQQSNFKFDEAELFDQTLRNLVSRQQAKKKMRQKFVTENYLPDRSFTPIESDEIVRTTMEIRIPRRIIDLLDKGF